MLRWRKGTDDNHSFVTIKRKESKASKRKRYLAKLNNPKTKVSEILNVKVWLKKNGGYG